MIFSHDTVIIIIYKLISIILSEKSHLQNFQRTITKNCFLIFARKFIYSSYTVLAKIKKIHISCFMEKLPECKICYLKKKFPGELLEKNEM